MGSGKRVGAGGGLEEGAVRARAGWERQAQALVTEEEGGLGETFRYTFMINLCWPCLKF